MRGTAGIEFHLWDRVVPEVYVQRDYNQQGAADVNGVGLVLNVYLR